MTVPLVFHPEVQKDVNEAYRWYEGQKAGLGKDFLAAIEEVYHRIQRMPRIHQLIYQDIRRGLPRRFPYGVFQIGLKSSRYTTTGVIPKAGKLAFEAV
jgi:hypothetical protein